jgi:hypothetical protein
MDWIQLARHRICWLAVTWTEISLRFRKCVNISCPRKQEQSFNKDYATWRSLDMPEFVARNYVRVMQQGQTLPLQSHRTRSSPVSY